MEYFLAVLVVGTLFALSVAYWTRRKVKVYEAIRRAQREYDEAFSASVEEQNRKWQMRLKAASHLLTGKSWQDADGKREFIEELYGPEIPQYLWFHLGKKKNLPSDNEFGEICEFFWGEKGPSLGDYEPHDSLNFPGEIILRIRSPRALATSVVANGKRCPLFQVGNNSILGEMENGVICFPRLYAQKEKGAA